MKTAALLVTAGILVMVVAMYACLVAGSRADDQLEAIDQQKWEEKVRNGGS